MREILVAAVALLALVGCKQKAADNHTVAAAPKAEAFAARKITASFDCDAARGQAQELVCADANLASMDREAARLGASDAAGQAAWAKARNDCGKADELRQCVMANAVLRIHHLLSVKPSDAGGISVGPVGFACKGLAKPISATFVNSDPGAVAVEVNGQTVALDHAEAASGARYTGRWNGKEWGFWEHGGEATLTIPDKPEMRCTIS
jgi:membrane-bound inhibitor of C-type lysozyme